MTARAGWLACRPATTLSSTCRVPRARAPRTRTLPAASPARLRAPRRSAADIKADPECTKGNYTKEEDEVNLRCFNQKRRFGFDLLYPTDRYVAGLSNGEVPDPADPNKTVPNPLYTPKGDKPARDKSLVFLAGIVGVPWQDVSTEDSWTGTGLQYLNAQELADGNRWDVILGSTATPPTDPLMIEQVDPRAEPTRC